MAPSIHSGTLQTALDHHRAGRFTEAEALYRRVLDDEPHNAEALRLLGTLAAQLGKPELGIALLLRALVHEPRNVEAHCNLGNAYQALGKLTEAIACYRAALQADPQNGNTYNNLGTALLATGNVVEAVEAFREAVRLDPNFFLAHSNLGSALCQHGNFTEAIEACREALKLNPQYAAAYNNLGNALAGDKKTGEAIVAYQKAISLLPAEADYHFNLGNALQSLGRSEEAAVAYQEAIRHNSNHPGAWRNLGNIYQEKGRLDEAMAAYRETIRVMPDHAGAYSGIGDIFQAQGRFDEAIEAYRRSLAHEPDQSRTLNNLSVALAEKWQIDEAITTGQEALRLDPNYPSAYNNLGNRHKDSGRLNEALDCFRKALSIEPSAASIHSNLVFSLSSHPAYDAEAILAEARRWDHQHASPLKSRIAHIEIDRNSNRPLRIGYVSPDFRHHVVGCNLLPLFREHDRQNFEIFCYSNVLSPDHVTKELQALSGTWRNITGLSDEAAAAMIRNDRIDILVDLALHTARNRLLLFAHKPAPIQVTYLAYAGTSGMATMDYRFSDPWLDPPGCELAGYSEQTFRLPHSYWCYEPFGPTPAVSPAADGQILTFGCLNNFSKVKPASLDLWAEILRGVPGSQLVLHSPPGFCREETTRWFAAQEVNPERIRFMGRQSWEKYLYALQHIDIALDPFPYGGGISTCDALWMGVPVVTLFGNTAVGRAGNSILSNIGLTDLVAETPERYVAIAIALANNPSRRRELRSSLHTKMENSPLRDARGHARAIEAAYREMWKRKIENG